MVAWLRHEWPLLASLVTALLFATAGKPLLVDLSHPLQLMTVLSWLFAVAILSAFGVVRHAEALANRLGEPFGTLILTLSVTAIEVPIIIASISGEHATAGLARDAMFAVIIIVLDAMVGLCLLLGGILHKEQSFNLQGAQSFLALIMPLAIISLVLPNYIDMPSDGSLADAPAIWVTIMSLALYGVFLVIQNSQHPSFFWSLNPQDIDRSGAPPEVSRSILVSASLLLAYLIPVILIAESFSAPIKAISYEWGTPTALGGFLVALIILAPESWAALRAAIANDLQRAVNLLLGSALATIALTTSAILCYGLIKDTPVILGLAPAETVLLTMTLILSILTFSSVRTNALLGSAHLILFLCFLMLLTS